MIQYNKVTLEIIEKAITKVYSKSPELTRKFHMYVSFPTEEAKDAFFNDFDNAIKREINEFKTD